MAPLVLAHPVLLLIHQHLLHLVLHGFHEVLEILQLLDHPYLLSRQDLLVVQSSVLVFAVAQGIRNLESYSLCYNTSSLVGIQSHFLYFLLADRGCPLLHQSDILQVLHIPDR